ncbi:hypothetical protein ST47_g3396 [Ascochyta rabiei]|uniref:Uncharacterized protein n=2 Tax=Didymella rabiei TaxID=5454 RepID=A0A163HTW2_DIDRA|nr:hypothetical protein ST47_g3396 [Ascochyta rabiei]
MPNQHYATHAPVRSSPLRERSANAGAGLFELSMASQPSEKSFSQSPRAYKAIPALQTRDTATKRRRDMFFKRVQNNRQDKRWESRGEQIQQLDFVTERKRWESKKAQEAPPEEHETDEELLSDAMLSSSSYVMPQPEPEMTEADHLLAQEEFELQQLIASMEQEPSQDMSHHYGSDDEDYDSIFMQCSTRVDWGYKQQQQQQKRSDYEPGEADDMDMTDG